MTLCIRRVNRSDRTLFQSTHCSKTSGGFRCVQHVRPNRGPHKRSGNAT